jgi:hypothetical protein
VLARLLPTGKEREGQKPSEGGVGWDWDELFTIWCEEGFPPDSFWHQTPRTFTAALEGKLRSVKREVEREVALAWHTAAFSGAAQAGKLKPLAKYLDTLSPKQAQTPAEMLAVLKTFKAAGADMEIRRLN